MSRYLDSSKGLLIELWETKYFESGILSIEQIKPLFQSRESIGTLSKASRELGQVTREVRTYDLGFHFEGWNQSRDLFDSLRP